ncbi:unnamed protein product [Protopolystoma xenopodis]|uniref:Uncharacterized protein n=1 Tax=Protopolystoma xenopodis TaxID=117903 RepID=A0A448XD39_9PLAT|nr:unnamed protein product [Protopolystoma xenopodis]
MRQVHYVHTPPWLLASTHKSTGRDNVGSQNNYWHYRFKKLGLLQNPIRVPHTSTCFLAYPLNSSSPKGLGLGQIVGKPNVHTKGLPTPYGQTGLTSLLL